MRGSSSLIPSAGCDLHASKEVQAEAPLWALVAKETEVHAFGWWVVERLCSNQGEAMAN